VRVNADRTSTKISDVPGLLGFALRADGDFVACGKNEAGAGVIYKLSTGGAKSVLVAQTFKQPNFIAVAKDDSIVFSDSSDNKLYRANADGSNVALITDAITYPNGLAFSVDGQTLYVASYNGKKVYALARKADGSYDAPTVFLDGVENVDGLATAADGDLFLVCSGLGVLRAHAGKTESIAPGSKFRLAANGAFGTDGWFYVSNLIGFEVTRVYVNTKGATLPVR
jgi:sugar lactone lactonase YvrE